MRSTLAAPALAFAFFSAVAACRPAPEPLGSEALARGGAAVAPFKSELKAALLAGMARGPVDAIQTCRVEAPRIATQNAAGSIEIGRTSHRLRNPKNAPRPWVEPILAEYLSASNEREREPRVVRLSGDRMGYVEPIHVQGLCLTCHGTSLDPVVAGEIARLYPEDHATGFAAGDLRGVLWAELPIP